MKENLNNLNLDLLEHIQDVETPPFLFNRISQKIKSDEKSRFSLISSWSLSLSFALVIMVNVFVIAKINREIKNKNNIAQIMHLMPENELYK